MPDVNVRLFAYEICQRFKDLTPFIAVDGDKGGHFLRFLLMYGGLNAGYENAKLAIPYVTEIGVRANWLSRKEGGFHGRKLNESQIKQYESCIEKIREMPHHNSIFMAHGRGPNFELGCRRS